MRFLLLLSICMFALSQGLNHNKTSHSVSMDSSDKYIIKFKDPRSMALVSSYIKAQTAKVSPVTLASIGSDQGIAVDAVTYGITSTYNSTFLSAVAVTLSEEDLGKLKKRYGNKIEYVEQDLKMYTAGTQENAPWGLARVGQWNSSASKIYRYPDAAGAGVDVYVLDSGVLTTHPSFEGRAKFLKNFVKGSKNNDTMGHGTRVAGVIGSSRYGVAKKANIYSVKVLENIGGGDYSAVISGIQFITARAKPGKTIINMSINGLKSQIIDDAVAAARKAGILVVAAAGNDKEDACGYSPSRSSHVITVGATDRYDKISALSESNWGKCVDIFAPGEDIISLGLKGKDESSLSKGTSMAASHVSGIAAIYMSIKSYRNPGDVMKDILAKSRKVLKGNVKGSPRRLAYVNAML